MKETVRLFITSRRDSIPDLDVVEDLTLLEGWVSQAENNCLKTAYFDAIEASIIDSLKGYTILELYGLIKYPPGKLGEADDRVGEKLLALLKDNAGKLRWDLQETGASKVSVDEQVKGSRYTDWDKYWENFTYGLLADNSLGEDEYVVYLEAAVKPF